MSETPPKQRPGEQFSAYLDQQMDAEQTKEFEQELTKSDDDQHELAQLQQLMEAVSSMPEVDAPEDLYENVTRKLRRDWTGGDGLLWSFLSLPFQVLSIVVIVTVAALYMLAQLQPTSVDVDTDAATTGETDPPPGAME